MRTAVIVAWLALVAACAGTPEMPADVQAVRDYVEVSELGETDRIRTHGSDAWSPATHYFALYKSRDGWYLLEFTRNCRELTDNTRVTADRRYDHNVMRRGIDTLRGCRIDRMYSLTDAQAGEIEALVQASDSGN
jgi:hypothetical protein